MKQKDNCQSVKKYLKNPLKIKNKLQAYGIRKKKNWKKQINEISEHTLPTIFTKIRAGWENPILPLATEFLKHKLQHF